MSLRRALERADLDAYLALDPIVDFADPAVLALAAELAGPSPLETARRCFEHVRDRVEHSSDHQRSPTTCSASSVLRAGTGFCYAKSHLLVALLRAHGLPAGFGYQRTRTRAAEPGFCLHGYAVVLLPEHGWYAIDPRGNKPGVSTSFAPPEEQLAFRYDHEGEGDLGIIFAQPLPEVLRCLQTCATWDAVLAALPDRPLSQAAPNTEQGA